jgi:hypothetical protein
MIKGMYMFERNLGLAYLHLGLCVTLFFLEHMKHVTWKQDHGKIGCKIIVFNKTEKIILIHIKIHINITSFSHLGLEFRSLEKVQKKVLKTL